MQKKSRQLIKQDAQTNAMRGRYTTAQFLEYDINSKAVENVTSIKEAERLRKKALNIQTKENLNRSISKEKSTN